MAEEKIRDDAVLVKKKFEKGGEYNQFVDELRKLPDEQIIELREGSPSNRWIREEHKRRGLRK